MAWTFTVSNLNEYVARSLASDPMLKGIQVTGEISNFKNHVSGHWYFDLKDDRSRISCVMYRQYNLHVKPPAEGDRVTLTGAAGLYTVSGRFQFYAQGMTRDGQGELYRRYLALKDQLLREGCFDEARKKPLPLHPQVVAVVTSRSGAVIHDIRTVSHRRDPSVQLILRPTLVQGEGAAEDIARGIEEAVQKCAPDVVIIGRGGGSMEDLWAFNEAVVVRAICACPVPVISAVGHETDVTLADLAADVRAATPSAAAEIAVPEREKLRAGVEKLVLSMKGSLKRVVLEKRGAVSALEKRLSALRPDVRLVTFRARTREAERSLFRSVRGLTALKRERVLSGVKRLEALGPRQALNRGYALMMAGGRLVRRTEDLKEEATVLLFDGAAKVRILDKKKGDPFEYTKTNEL